MIFDFDEIDEFENLEKSFEVVEKLRNSISVDRRKFVNFFEALELDPRESLEAIDRCETSLIIDTYTYSERLLKSTVYHILEFESNKNHSIDLFIEDKIPQARFVPNSKFEEFKKQIEKLSRNYKFFLKRTHPSVKPYDFMIDARHKYAHRHIAPPSLEQMKQSFEMISYLTWECQNCISSDRYKRNKLYEQYSRLQNETKKFFKKLDNVDKGNGEKIPRNSKIRHHPKLYSKVKEIRKIAKVIKNSIYIFEGLDVFIEYIDIIDRISNWDFREINLGTIESILKTLKENYG
ncbi:hypothetical protein CS009_00505 [Streptococcus macedonicus]|uniref:Uncharacterized protein n=1 Tax=Streptococcus macedonicus TaxID=59310 RepID=A0AAP8KD80_STRMC|nr:hypothetical protein [Streptococcus macedonicus]PHV58979.1 hypothetical protein CS009_00505 [Streptococcus macedonicus]